MRAMLLIPGNEYREIYRHLTVRVMMFNATLKSIYSYQLRRSVLLLEETGGPGETHRPTDKVVSSKLRLSGI